MDTLSLFATTASETKMDISNLAVVFCPGILRHPDHNTPIQYKISQYVIEFLIEFQSLFTMQLLIPNKRRNTSSAGVPPVPLLVSSSATKTVFPSSTSPSSAAPTSAPPVPLHVMNPSDPSIKSIISLDQDPFVDSPQEIVAQRSQERSIHTADEQLGVRAIRLATPYYRLFREKFTEFRRAVEPYIGKYTHPK